MNKARVFHGREIFIDREWYFRLRAAYIDAAKKTGSDRDAILRSVNRAILRREAIEANAQQGER